MQRRALTAILRQAARPATSTLRASSLAARTTTAYTRSISTSFAAKMPADSSKAQTKDPYTEATEKDTSPQQKVEEVK